MDEKRKVNRFIDIIHKIADSLGLYIEGRIVVRDKKTGRRYE